MDESDRTKLGMTTRRAVLGDDHVDRALPIKMRLPVSFRT